MSKIETINEIIFSKFVRYPYGHILDYVNLNGDTPIPTKEECEEGMPNVLSWWTPIENGAFFNGLYLYALINEYALTKSVKTKEQIDILFRGMKIFQDVGKQEGFIARGVADDGQSHYPFGSDDQTGPFLLSLYKLYKSGIYDDETNADIKNRIVIVINRLKNNEWFMPTEYAGINRGAWGNSDWRGVAKYLFCNFIMAELTGERAWRDSYENGLNEVPKGGFFRRGDIIGNGFSHGMVREPSLIQFWIDMCGTLCIKELFDNDSANKSVYGSCLYLNAVTVQPFIGDYKTKTEFKDAAFDVDFRKLKRFFKPFDGDGAAAVENALYMDKFWQKDIVPRRKYEHAVLANSLFCMWIAIISSDKALAEYAFEKLNDCIDFIDWNKVNMCYGFVAHSAYIQYLCRFPKKA